MGVKAGSILVSIPKLWTPAPAGSARVEPVVIPAIVIESVKIKAKEANGADTDYNTGDTVFIREDAGTQFVLDGQAVAAVVPWDIIYHRVKK